MSEIQKKRRVIWAVNPFAGDIELLRSSAEAIRSLIAKEPVEIEPVYVLGAGYYTTILPLLSNSLTEIRLGGQEVLRRALDNLSFKNMKPLHVLAEGDLSLQQSIYTLLTYAHATKADLIVVNTHAKKGPERWMMGSFAETLSLRSDLPLLVVNPKWSPAQSNFKKIFFPTDFSAESHEAFRQVVQLAKSIGGEIKLYHRFAFDIPPTIFPVYQSYDVSGDAYKRDVKTCNDLAAQWTSEAIESQVKVTSEIDVQASESVVHSILIRSQGYGLIAMASHSGRLSRLILGSTTRGILRSAQVPVWVVHPTRTQETADVPQKEAYQWQLQG